MKKKLYFMIIFSFVAIIGTYYCVRQKEKELQDSLATHMNIIETDLGYETSSQKPRRVVHEKSDFLTTKEDHQQFLPNEPEHEIRTTESASEMPVGFIPQTQGP